MEHLLTNVNKEICRSVTFVMRQRVGSTRSCLWSASRQSLAHVECNEKALRGHIPTELCEASPCCFERQQMFSRQSARPNNPSSLILCTLCT